MTKFHRQVNHDAHEGAEKHNDAEENETSEYSENVENVVAPEGETAVATSGFGRWFWGTIIVLALITLTLTVIPMLRQSSTPEATLKVTQQASGPHEISASKLKDVLSNPKVVALDAVLSEVPQSLDQAYQPVYEAISEYADFHYSIKGEYTELYVASLGNPAENLQSILFDGLDERLESMADGLDYKFYEVFKTELLALLQHEESTNGELGALTQRVISDVNARIVYTAPLAASTAIGGGVALRVAAKTMSKKLAAKVAAKAVATSGGKLASTLAGAGAAAGTATLVCGPAAAVCGVAGGAVAWFATDYGILMVDESWSREDFESDLRLLIDEMKEAHRMDIEQTLFLRAIATEGVINEFVEYQDFTLRELNGVGNQKICSVARDLASEYELMSSSINARNTEALDSLREIATTYEGHVAIGRLAGEIKKNLKNAEDIKVIQFEISGNLSKDYRADREVSGLLALNGKQFQIGKVETTVQDGFSITSSLDAELNLNKSMLYDIAFEQHLRVKGNRYFSGSGKVDNLAEVGTSEGLSKNIELLIPITRHSSASLQQVVARKTTESEQVRLALKLQAEALPSLEMRPTACN